MGNQRGSWSKGTQGLSFALYATSYETSYFKIKVKKMFDKNSSVDTEPHKKRPRGLPWWFSG